MASVLLDKTGAVSVTCPAGTKIGLGTDFVAMALKVEALWLLLQSTCLSWASQQPPPTPDGGLGLASAIASAIGVPNVKSGNLKAD